MNFGPTCRASCLISVTHVDDERQRLPGVVLDQLLLARGEELRVLHVLQQEATFVWLPLLFLAVVGEGSVAGVEEPVQEELHRGLLGLAGGRGRAGDRGGGDHGAALQQSQRGQGEAKAIME